MCVCVCGVCAFFQAEWFLGTVHRGKPQTVVRTTQSATSDEHKDGAGRP